MNLQATAFDPENPDRSYTLPADLYTAANGYARDQSAVFGRSWNFVCHCSQVAQPGEFVRVDIADEEILVVRDRAGTLRAFYNVCVHRAHTLVQEDAGRLSLITCPYHSWCYRLDGSLATARNCENVQAFNQSEAHLKSVRLENFGGLIFVNLDQDAIPLADQAPDLLESLGRWCPQLPDLKFAQRLRWEVKCNWKTAIENFCECYHCAPAHPAFVDFVDMQSYGITTHGIWSVHISRTGAPDKSPYDYQSGGGATPEYIGIYLWPNQTIWVMPGAGNIALLYMQPTGPETCREVMDFYFTQPIPSAAEAESIAYLRDVLQPEDIGLCERVQKGLRSRSYNAGRLIVDAQRSCLSEHAVHHFQKLYHKALNL
jgi:carnitine monooxygenase subunit